MYSDVYLYVKPGAPDYGGIMHFGLTSKTCMSTLTIFKFGRVILKLGVKHVAIYIYIYYSIKTIIFILEYKKVSNSTLLL